jgi:hypothetical protein
MLKRVQPTGVLRFDSRCWSTGVAVAQLSKFYELYKVSDRGEVVVEHQPMLSAIPGPTVHVADALIVGSGRAQLYPLVKEQVLLPEAGSVAPAVLRGKVLGKGRVVGVKIWSCYGEAGMRRVVEGLEQLPTGSIIMVVGVGQAGGPALCEVRSSEPDVELCSWCVQRPLPILVVVADELLLRMVCSSELRT